MACCTVVGPDAGMTVAVRSWVQGSSAVPGMHSHSTPAASVFEGVAPSAAAALAAGVSPGVRPATVEVVVVGAVEVGDAALSEPQAASPAARARMATSAIERVCPVTGDRRVTYLRLRDWGRAWPRRPAR